MNNPYNINQGNKHLLTSFILKPHDIPKQTINKAEDFLSKLINFKTNQK